MGARLGLGAATGARAGGRSARTSVYVICPEHQAMFGDAGWSKQRLREALFEVVRRPARELATRRDDAAASTRPARTTIITRWTSPDEIVLLAAGGEAGRYSALLGPCLGMESQIVSKEVRWTT